LLSAVSISPQTATIDLSGTNSQVFILDGTNAAHDWIILNPIPETSGQTVAQFSGSASGVSTVTLQGVEKGTFQLQATPTAGGDAVTSGTIQVVQRITHNLDVDGNGSADGLTDGLLIIRYLFGIPGDALIANAVAADSTRSSASEIENFLENATTAILDIDGNGTADGLTDGLLIIRYLFGIPGDALTAGAVSTDCTRCSAQEIEAYLEKLLP
jgi:hypothetical protein